MLSSTNVISCSFPIGIQLKLLPLFTFKNLPFKATAATAFFATPSSVKTYVSYAGSLFPAIPPATRT